MTEAGTAYVTILPDLKSFNSALAAGLAKTPMGKYGKLAAGVAGVGAAAVVAGKQLYDIGVQFDDAYDRIRTNTGKTGKELRGLKGDFKAVIGTVPADFDDASTAIAGLNQRLGLTGKPLRQLSRQMLELSRITETDLQGNIQSITRVFGDWGVKTREQPAFLDRLFRASQATGIEIGRLSDYMVQFGSPLRQMGFDFDTAAAMFSKFEKEGVNLQTAMPGLRMALKGFAEDGRDPAKALAETIEKIEEASSTAKANTMAFEIFGTRAGPDLAAAIREGRFDFDKLIRRIRSGDDTIMKAGRQTRDFQESWELFRNQAMIKLEPVARRVFKVLGDGMAILSDPKLSTGQKWDKITTAITGAMSDAITATAGRTAQLAPKVAGAFIKGFANADIWGQLVTGGLLIAKFGGLGGFSKLGRGAGAKFGAGFLLAVTGMELFKQAKNIIMGNKLDATDREDLAHDLREAFSVDWGDVLFKNRGKNTQVSTALGKILVNNETQEVVRVSSDRLKGLIGEKWLNIVDDFNRLVKRTERHRAVRADQFFDNMAKRWGPDAKRTGAEIGENFGNGVAQRIWASGPPTKKALNGIIATFAGFKAPVRRSAIDAMEEWADSLRDTGDKKGARAIERVIDRVRREANAHKAQLRRAGEDGGQAFTKGFGSGTNKTIAALQALVTNVNNTLAGVGAAGKEVDVAWVPFNTSAFYAVGGKVTAPRAIVGEEAPNHPEWVIATNPRYRKDNLKHWMDAGHDLGVPGFAKGGQINKAHFGGARAAADIAQGGYDKAFKGALQYLRENMIGASWPAIDRLARQYGLSITSTYRPGDEGSLHGIPIGGGRAKATDYSNSTGPTPQMFKFATQLGESIGSKLNELIYTPLGWSIDHGHRTAPYAQAEHYNHVHVGLFRKGGLLGRASEKLSGMGRPGKPVAAGGPDRSAKKLSNAQMKEMVTRHYPWNVGGGRSKLPGALIAALAEHFGIPGRTAEMITRGESGGDPGAIGDDRAAGYGDTWGWGLYQITTGPGGTGYPNGDVVAKFGGKDAMNVPLNNTKAMAYMRKQAGDWSPWRGTSAVTNWNAHYDGKIDMAAVLGAAGGAGGGGAPDLSGTRNKHLRELLQNARGVHDPKKSLPRWWAVMDYLGQWGDWGDKRGDGFLKKARQAARQINPWAARDTLRTEVHRLLKGEHPLSITGEKSRTSKERLDDDLKRIRKQERKGRRNRYEQAFTTIATEGLSPGLRRQFRNVQDDLGSVGNTIEGLQELYESEWSEAGSEYSGDPAKGTGEVGQLLGLYNRKLADQLEQYRLAEWTKGSMDGVLQWVDFDIKEARQIPELRWKLPALRQRRRNANRISRRMTEAMTTLGDPRILPSDGLLRVFQVEDPNDFRFDRFGDIFRTRLEIKNLGASSTVNEGPANLDISQLRDLLEGARYGVFDSQIPKFHQGGVYRSPPGQSEGLALLRDREEILTPEQRGRGDTYVAHIHLANGVTQVVEMEFEKRDRRAALAARAGA